MANRSTLRTQRTEVRRIAHNAGYDRGTINAILDEALIAHIGFVDDGQPFVIPTIQVRIGDCLYIHGSGASRMILRLQAGSPACITVTLLDGLVLARSMMHHSMNYRSVVILARAQLVEDREEKMRVLRHLTEHVVAGRWEGARQPSEVELKATTVLAFPIDEASAKIRTGPPKDDEADYALDHWAGVIPLAITASPAVADPKLREGIITPDYILNYCRSS